MGKLRAALAWWADQDDLGGFASVAHRLFPGWTVKRHGRAPHREDRNPSFSLYRNERGKWKFKDFGRGEQGGLVEFVMLAGLSKQDAIQWLVEAADLQPDSRHRVWSPRSGRGCIQGASASPIPRPLPAIPEKTLRTWEEGVAYLQTRPEEIERIATWRGWPVEFTGCLAESMTMSMPRHHGVRSVAFPVMVPEQLTNGLGARMIGFHARLPACGASNRAEWRFMPNMREHGQTTPALPFVLGRFDTAKLLIVTEGQWDLLSFASAAGWMGVGCHWPDEICMVGIRGAGGVTAFLARYEPFWPKRADCLLLPDHDQAGRSWTTGLNAFDQRLLLHCRKVVVESCAPHKDFNDLYRTGAVGPNDIEELLDRHFGARVERGTP